MAIWRFFEVLRSFILQIQCFTSEVKTSFSFGFVGLQSFVAQSVFQFVRLRVVRTQFLVMEKLEHLSQAEMQVLPVTTRKFDDNSET